MNRGDRVNTPDGPGMLLRFDHSYRWVFGRQQHDVYALVELPGRRRRFYLVGEVSPLPTLGDNTP